jgi:hypothetical protein
MTVMAALLLFAHADYVRAQRIKPSGVRQLPSMSDTTRAGMSVSERHAAKRLFFGVVTGAAAGALMAYGWVHSPMAGPNESARAYKFFVPFWAVGGGAFGLAGLWWCPGDCR